MIQRTHEREEFRHQVSIDFGVTGMESHGCEVGSGMGVDISSAGVGITCPLSLKDGDVVLLTLPLGEVGAQIPVYAEVVWQQPAGSDFRTGLRFLV